VHPSMPAEDLRKVCDAHEVPYLPSWGSGKLVFELAGPGYVAGAVASLAALGTGVVMLSIWAPPVMTTEELAPLRHGQVHRPKELTDASSVV
jgi:hypothetical protein